MQLLVHSSQQHLRAQRVAKLPMLQPTLPFCSVAPGQVLPHLTQQQQAALGALAQRKPLDHKACIEALLSASIGVVSDPGVRSFGVEVAGGMVGGSGWLLAALLVSMQPRTPVMVVVSACVHNRSGITFNTGSHSWWCMCFALQASVRARVLPAPCLAYGAPECMLPSTQVGGGQELAWKVQCCCLLQGAPEQLLLLLLPNTECMLTLAW